MNIIICGAGRVGFTIAKLLTEQDHSITVIDQSSEDIQKINESLDVKAIVGKGTYPSILEKANATDAEGNGTDPIDILSNGFKLYNAAGSANQNGGTYIYMAFGQSLVGSNNIPCTAR